jgi:glycosyltransferase involved in cell wall biosynthesis
LNCSLVIRAFNEEEHIGRLLEGISHQTVKDVEIILVDSGSTDATTVITVPCGADVVYIPPTDGKTSLLTVAEKTGLPLGLLAAGRLLDVVDGDDANENK